MKTDWNVCCYSQKKKKKCIDPTQNDSLTSPMNSHEHANQMTSEVLQAVLTTFMNPLVMTPFWSLKALIFWNCMNIAFSTLYKSDPFMFHRRKSCRFVLTWRWINYNRSRFWEAWQEIFCFVRNTCNSQICESDYNV